MEEPTRQIGLADTPITRRRLLQASAAAGITAFLAACTAGGGGSSATAGVSSAAPSPSPEGSPSAGPETAPASASASAAELEGPLNFANWPAYIDLNEEETESPTLVDFQERYGIEVNYVEDIQDNADFLATIEPQLQSGLDTGWDLMVITDPFAARLIRQGWVEKIDQANTPNAVKNVRDGLKDYEWDPNFDYHFPWQSGASGVGYNSKSTGRDLTKTADLFDDAFAGKTTLLAGYQDTFSLIGLMLRDQGKLERTPPEYTVEDGQVIHDYIKPFVESGHVRAFTGNEYLQDFASGDTWVAEVYSGDLASSGGEDDVFIYPEEGSVIWTDNMLIPKGAQHRRAAEAMIDFVYEVPNAARLAAWIYYISPVKGAAEEIAKSDPELAQNPLLFPPPEITEKQYGYPNVTDDEDQQLNDLSSDLEGT
jgi:spermidine/putrescine transport system substrate-binding protein